MQLTTVAVFVSGERKWNKKKKESVINEGKCDYCDCQILCEFDVLYQYIVRFLTKNGLMSVVVVASFMIILQNSPTSYSIHGDDASVAESTLNDGFGTAVES